MNRWRPIAVCAMAAAMASCSQPQTDIVATTTEDVGGYDVVATSADRGLTATVCVTDPRHSDAIARRIVQQVANHHFASVTLDLIGPARASGSNVVRVVWTPDRGLQMGDTGRRESATCAPAADKPKS